MRYCPFFPLIRIRFTQNTQNTRVYFFARVAKATNAAFLLCVVGPRRKERGERKRERERETRTRGRRDVWRPNSATIKRKISSAGRHLWRIKTTPGRLNNNNNNNRISGGLFGNAGNGSQSGNAVEDCLEASMEIKEEEEGCLGTPR